jgi:N-succinyldiaminopimelate aminotransferase
MPRYPDFSARTARVSGSVFETFRARMAAQGDRLAGLHIGDTYTPPPFDLPVDQAFLDGHPGFHRYCDTFGIAELRDALVEKLRAENALEVTRDHVMVTAGSCNALNSTVLSVVDPGDEVMLLSPFWPFIRGMVRMAGGTPVEVPLYTALYEDDDLDIVVRLEDALTDRTVAVYLNSPNNPSGKVLSRAQLGMIANFCERRSLWLISDEAYDGMTYDGREHVSPATLPDGAERTISVFTFSKVYMFAGLRLGYAVAPPGALRVINKAMVHQLYGPSTLGQQMMVEPLRTRAQWSRRFVDQCAAMRERVAKALRVDAPLPDGAYYFFFDATPYLHGRSYDDVIGALLDAGVSVAPGGDFGEHFKHYIRICFAGEAPDRVMEGIERLNRVLVR